VDLKGRFPVDLGKEFQDICRELLKMRAHVAETLASDGVGPEFRPRIEALAKDFDRALAEARTEFPKGLQEAQEHHARNVRTLEQVNHDRKETERQLAELEKAIAQPPAPPAARIPKPPGLPANHGQMLRSELLSLLGISDDKTRGRKQGDVLDMSSGTWRPEDSQG